MATAGNHLIGLLPRAERLPLLSSLQRVTLAFGEALAEPGTATRHVYFPIDCFISLVTSLGGRPILEVGMVGREGLLGVQLALGVPAVPLYALVQGPGDAWRIGAPAFRRALAGAPALGRLLDRYLYVLMVQFAASAACIRFHEIDQRLARWLLMTRDRSGSNRFRITHEFLAYMLGVRRVGITTAAGALQRRGLIEYHRGNVAILDPAGLQRTSCSCYAANNLSYTQLLGTP